MKLKKAMQLYPIVKTPAGQRSPVGRRVCYEQYDLGEKVIWKGAFGWRSQNRINPMSKACQSESAAVAWLIEGATPKPKEPVTVAVEREFGVMTLHTIILLPDEAQAICDQLYRAGYRPNKGGKE